MTDPDTNRTDPAPVFANHMGDAPPTPHGSSEPLLSFAGATTGPVSVDDVVGRDKITTIHYPQPQRDGPPFSAPYPSPNQPLVGRDELLTTIRMRLFGTALIRLALDGLPGVGKTRLALELAYDASLRDHFAGGVLMASLGQQPLHSNIIRRWCDDLDLPFDPSVALDAQLQRIVVQLNRTAQPFLIIIDDVWEPIDARPFLLRSPYASVLFTGRQRDAFHSVDLGDLVGPTNLITIPPLDKGQAVALLRQSAELPASEYQSELEAVAALVGGLPLLLATVGRYLRDQRQHQQTAWFEVALADMQSAAQRLNLPISSIAQTRPNLRRGLFARFGRKPATVLNARAVIALSIAALPRAAQAECVNSL